MKYFVDEVNLMHQNFATAKIATSEKAELIEGKTKLGVVHK